MEHGTNRNKGGRIEQVWNNWVNNSVGAIMFLNSRSAVLQTISMINFINWSDNNPLKAGAAFLNQKQFWADFVMIFNSDVLRLSNDELIISFLPSCGLDALPPNPV